MPNPKIPHGKRLIWRATVTKNGKVIHASAYGIRAFPILVDE